MVKQRDSDFWQKEELEKNWEKNSKISGTNSECTLLLRGQNFQYWTKINNFNCFNECFKMTITLLRYGYTRKIPFKIK